MFILDKAFVIDVSIYFTRTHLNPLKTGSPETDTFANSEDRDEMQQTVAFHSVL